MSNPRAWRAKPRTPKPNSRQKRNGLFLDARPVCQNCWGRPSDEAHHALSRDFLGRNRWIAMQALCATCHVLHHRQVRITFSLETSQAGSSKPFSTS